ncbi:helix-turn-helix transcriptional regulator [Arthrobacter castelli]|uniref:helix-turn-helix transcriptional regulator n=1 Tax=Arthrobacter castelli TaxID=271431 RepID=UPI0004138696|nr:WYL domain-containing protein [Arthrobacter castelli]
MSALRTERLLNLIIALLDTRWGRTKDFLRRNIPQYKDLSSQETFERTFERDKADLRDLGIPISATSGDTAFEDDTANTVYRIAKEAYRMPPVRFTGEEAAVLSLASRLWQQASLGSAAARAVRKLQGRGVVPETDSIIGIEPRIRTAEPAFDAVFKAVAQHRTIEFSYLAASTGQQQRRTVQPWGIGEKYGHWYLAGYDLDRRDERTFRLSRMVSAVHLRDETFERPGHFDVQESLARLDTLTAEETAVLHVRPSAAHSLRLRAGTAAAAGSSDWDEIRFEYTDTEVMADEIASYGPLVQVMAPEQLRAAVVRRLTGVVQASAQPVPAISFPEPEKDRKTKTTSIDRLQRLLDMVPYLLDTPGADLAGTAAGFGVSEQQLVKDLELLFVCGLPGHGPEDLIDATWDDGVIDVRNADELSEPVHFSIEEACALIVGLQTLATVPGAGSADALESALAKITAAAGDSGQLKAAVKADITPHIEATTIDVIHGAVAARQRLRLSYVVPHRDEVTERVIEPFRLFSADDRWYVEAWCLRAEAVRNFRLDRIRTIEQTGESATGRRPAETEFPSSLFTPGEDDVQITVVMNQRALWVAEHYNADRTALLDDGTTAARFRVGTTSWLPQLTARAGGDVRVVEPQPVAAQCQQWAEQALAYYDGGTAPAGNRA